MKNDAFEKWYVDFYGIENVSSDPPTKYEVNAWNAAMRHAAEICLEQKKRGIDFFNADAFAATIRAEIGEE
jgi:hypothetical protein